METQTLNLHGFLPRSRANGPGVRAVVWVQGCTLGCPGCYNPGTHPHRVGSRVPAGELAERILGDAAALEGVTLTGGEPLQQPVPILALLRRVRADGRLGVLLFSGYTLLEIAALRLGPAVLDHVDALIAGRYEERRRVARGLRGSANKEIHLLTGRYTREQIEAAPPAEVVLTTAGELIATGIEPLQIAVRAG